MALLGGKAKGKHRKGTPTIPQTPFTAAALAKIQEEARLRATAQYRAPAQARFESAWGLDGGDAR